MKIEETKPIVFNGVEIGQVHRNKKSYVSSTFIEPRVWHGYFTTEQDAIDFIVKKLKPLRDKLNQAFEEKP